MPDRPPLLDEPVVRDWLVEHSAWERVGDQLRRTVSCATFPAAIELVRQVAEVAERHNHHPDIDIRWRDVTFVLSTHDVGGLTSLDLKLAEAIDQLSG